MGEMLEVWSLDSLQKRLTRHPDNMPLNESRATGGGDGVLLWESFFLAGTSSTTMVKSSKHRPGKPEAASAGKGEFQRLRKEKRRCSRSQR